MQELSLNVLDIAQNSIKADASLVTIVLDRDRAANTLAIEIHDDGCGMTEEQVAHVTDPFYTTRTTRKVGLGVPFFKMTAEMTGGAFSLHSQVGRGTDICAFYHTDHIDMFPVGDMTATIVSLVSVNPQIDFCYISRVDGREFTMDTREVKQVLEGVPVNAPEVLTFIRDYITENQREIESDEQED